MAGDFLRNCDPIAYFGLKMKGCLILNGTGLPADIDGVR